MTDLILKVLKEENIEKYTVSKSITESAELYLIKKKADMYRTKNKEICRVNVYKDFEENGTEFTGNAEVVLYPSMDESEIRKVIKDAYFSAGFVKNKKYDIACGETADDTDKYKSDKSLEEIMLEVKDALYKNDILEKGFINSAEIFVTKSLVRNISSKGADVKYVSFSINGEFITQWKEKNDVETYNSFSYENLNAEDLALRVKEGIEDAGYRDKAENAPKTGKYNVIIKDNDALEFFNYYTRKANAGNIYLKYSDAAIGDKIQGENIKGDKLNAALTSSVPYNVEGIKLKDIPLIEDGILKNIHGITKFMQYLNLKPSGSYNGIKIKEGTISYKDLMEEGDLFILKFSDFQSNVITGIFGGEIRLALLKQNEKLIPLTGGSLSADTKEVQEDMVFSKESLQIYGADTVPKAVKFKNVLISGN